jgi:peptide/nickel transport system substrate-binding protein
MREVVGSGPFRFRPDEWNPGARLVYERFDQYQPREQGVASGTAGPKTVHFERVEWSIISDPATAVATLQQGGAEWLDYILHDLVPLVQHDPEITVRVLQASGIIAIMRLNHLVPPFDNPAIRRALLGAVDQTQYMRAIVGDDTSMFRAPVGVFCPDTPMANDAGMDVFTAPRDPARVRREIADAGYAGEKVVMLVPGDSPSPKALSEVALQMLRQVGLVVDDQVMDWSTVQQRRQSKAPIAQGGWSLFCTNGWNGTDMLDPVAHTSLRANGLKGWFGWPTSPRLEALRQDWMAAGTLAEQQRIAAELQRQCWIDVPYIPLGQNFQPTAYRRSIEGILPGFPMFWNVRPVS